MNGQVLWRKRYKPLTQKSNIHIFISLKQRKKKSENKEVQIIFFTFFFNFLLTFGSFSVSWGHLEPATAFNLLVDLWNKPNRSAQLSESGGLIRVAEAKSLIGNN